MEGRQGNCWLMKERKGPPQLALPFCFPFPLSDRPLPAPKGVTCEIHADCPISHCIYVLGFVQASARAGGAMAKLTAAPKDAPAITTQGKEDAIFDMTHFNRTHCTMYLAVVHGRINWQTQQRRSASASKSVPGADSTNASAVPVSQPAN